MAQLEQNFKAVWQRTFEELQMAVTSAKHPWHLITVASISDGLPDARIVVLRGCYLAEKTQHTILSFHTDYRSPKIQQFQANPEIFLLFYDAQTKRQLRVHAKCTVRYKDEVTQKRWVNAADSSRRCYLVHPSPSMPMETRETTLPKAYLKTVPTIEQAAEGYDNFCVIECTLQKIDILQLNAQGGERCLIEFADDGTFRKAGWLSP